MDTNERAFYELAATLIPILVFGGVVAGTLQPPDKFTRLRTGHLHAAYAIYGVLTVLILAEVTALVNVITPIDTTFTRLFVAGSLVVGLVAVALALLAPWAQRLWQEGNKREVRQIIAGALLGVVLLTVLNTNTLKEALDASDTDPTNAETRTRAHLKSEIAYAQARVRFERDGKVDADERSALELLGILARYDGKRAVDELTGAFDELNEAE